MPLFRLELLQSFDKVLIDAYPEKRLSEPFLGTISSLLFKVEVFEPPLGVKNISADGGFEPPDIVIRKMLGRFGIKNEFGGVKL